MYNKIRFLFLKFLVINSFFFNFAHALPSSEVYWERVANGLRWHRDEDCCLHLTEDKILQIEPIVKVLSQREAELKNDYYQVITGQDSRFLAYQIILKEFYKLKYGQSFDEYEFLRPYNDPELRNDLSQFFSEHPDLLDADRLMAETENMNCDQLIEFWENVENDTYPEITRQLISASLTLETTVTLDSAQFVFANGSGMCGMDDWSSITTYLQDAFLLEGIDSKKAGKFINEVLERAPFSKEGILMQIFVPKDFMKDLGYVSFGGGFVKKVETDSIEIYFSDHEAKRDSIDFNTMENDQVRLLVGNLDPTKVKIFRYSMVDDEVIKAFEEFVAFSIKEFLNITD